eukprot:3130423-Pleurochrysis_carterae.AAC.3
MPWGVRRISELLRLGLRGRWVEEEAHGRRSGSKGGPRLGSSSADEWAGGREDECVVIVGGRTAAWSGCLGGSLCVVEAQWERRCS